MLDTTMTPVEKEMQKELHIKKLELSALLEITQAINNDLPESVLYKIYNFTLLGQLNVQKLSLFVWEEKWVCRVNFGTIHNFTVDDLPVEVTKVKEMNYVSKLPLDRKWREFDIVIPIIHNNTVLAYLFLGNSNLLSTERTELSFIQTLSNILIVAIENRRLMRQRLAQESMRKEIEIAKEVQNMLFPKRLPNGNDITIHASYVPHSSIGGDYYDFIEIDEDQFLFCVADVSGKGVPASLLMSNFQAGLRTILRQTTDLRTVVTELNYLIYRNAIADRFITSFLAIFNRKTRELSYVNAGHNSPVLLYENDTHRLLNEGCTMLGAFDVLPFLSVTEVNIPHKSVLLCYTDGLTEVFNSEEDEYGIENTITFLKKSRYYSSNLLHNQLLKEIEDYNAGKTFGDDITILSCRFK